MVQCCWVIVQCLYCVGTVWSGYSELFDYLILFPFLLHLCSFLLLDIYFKLIGVQAAV